MSINDLLIMMGVIAMVSLIIAAVRGSRKAREIGRIRCRRCHYEGPVKSKTRWLPFRGMVPELLCPTCGSPDWERI